MSFFERAAASLQKNGLGGSLRYFGNELRMQAFRLRYRRTGRPSPAEQAAAPLPPPQHITPDGNGEAPPGRLAVQLHLFYPDTLPDLLAALRAIPMPFDCFVSTDTPEKQAQLNAAFADAGIPATVEIFPNRGRDVAPLLAQMRERIDGYDYLLHLHSKRTVASDFGGSWRENLLRTLAGSPAQSGGALARLAADETLGLLFPAPFDDVGEYVTWTFNREATITLLRRMGLRDNTTDPPVFPVGNMFYARVDAVRPLFDLPLTPEDFPREHGQRDATLAHAVERVWVYLAAARGYTYGLLADPQQAHGA